jgi:hypothetical protein
LIDTSDVPNQRGFITVNKSQFVSASSLFINVKGLFGYIYIYIKNYEGMLYAN